MENELPWHDDDNLWQSLAPALFTQQRWADTPNEVEQVISTLDIEPRARILDLCCGVGRHSLELARRGFKVTGVDRTQAYLDSASHQAEQEGLVVEFIQDDMRTFRSLGAFDAVINLFTSFGYFEDPGEDRQVVMNVYHSLKPGGAFLLQMMGKEVLARIFRERDWTEEKGVLVLQERKLARNWGWIENRWIIIDQGRRTDFYLAHRIYSAMELTSLLSECGFAQVTVYGDLERSLYDHQATMLVAVAHK